jgi:CelD/BcsL family acetyltransferase involved in cellulose biosynthesis
MRTPRLSVEVADQLEPLAEEWKELAEAVGAAPFLHPSWFRAWLASFGAGRLRILVVRRNRRLLGLVPMLQRHGALRSPTNAHSPTFDLLAVDAHATRALAQGLFASRAREVGLDCLEARGPGIGALSAAAREAGYRATIRTTARSPYVPRAERSLAEHERSLSSNLRHDVERRLRRLCETGAVSVELYEGGEELDARLEEGFRVEASNWKGARGTAIASQSATRRFYTEIARWAASQGWLRLVFLRLDGRPIAFQFDLEDGARYYSLKIGYDREYERFSPGKLLTHCMVSRFVVSGPASYELLGTDEEWKFRWTGTSRERARFLAFARSPAGFLTWSTYAYGRLLARRLPFATRLAGAARRWTGTGTASL